MVKASVRITAAQLGEDSDPADWEKRLQEGVLLGLTNPHRYLYFITKKVILGIVSELLE